MILFLGVCMRSYLITTCAMMAAVTLSGCGQTQVAQVVDRGNSYFGRDGVVALLDTPNATVEEGTYQSAVTLPVEVKDVTQPSESQLALQPTATASSWQWPVSGIITGRFGQTVDGVANEGILIAAAEGTPIRASQTGQVIYVGNNAKMYGNIVILRHAGGDMTSYSHARNIIVKKGDLVEAGTTLGYVGRTGNVKSPALHFAVRENGTSVDPLKKLPHQVASN